MVNNVPFEKEHRELTRLRRRLRIMAWSGVFFIVLIVANIVWCLTSMWGEDDGLLASWHAFACWINTLIFVVNVRSFRQITEQLDKIGAMLARWPK